MDKDLIIRARKASMEEYLKDKGEVLLKEGRQYRVKRHSGLVVSGNKWYSHTLLKGGNTVDYTVFNKKYALRGFKVYSHFPEQKDWNQHLLSGIRCDSSMRGHN